MSRIHLRSNNLLAGLLLAVFLVALSVPAYAQVWDAKETVFQVSTLSELEHGIFYPVTTVGELKKHGNIGVGAFEAMDGELILLDGKAYNAMYSGKVVPVDDKAPITYSAVSYMNANRTMSLQNITSYADLQKTLEKELPNINNYYAFRIDGTFSYMKVRSTAKQELPYPPLSVVTANQSVFELTNVKGTLVGFRLPTYIKGVYAPGFHLHFITDDRQAGGHLLELNFTAANVQIGYLTQMHIMLPDNEALKTVDLSVPYK